MNNYPLNQEQLDKLTALLKPTMDVLKTAMNTSIVFVVGASGDGKSTLLNQLAGCQYIRKKNDLGNVVATLSPDSPQQEVCKVGRNPQKSETRCPQLIKPQTDQNQNAPHFNYCDLPGYFETGSEAEAICAAAGPHIVSRAAKSIKGFIWALSLNQFEVNKSEGIKKILNYLLAKSKNNPDLIAESLIIVITRTNNPIAKDQVLNRLKAVIDAIADPKQKQLLGRIVSQISNDASKLIISDVFDHSGLSIENMNAAVSALHERDKDDFDFSNYNEQQERFNQSLIEVAQLFLESSDQLQKDKGKADLHWC